MTDNTGSALWDSLELELIPERQNQTTLSPQLASVVSARRALLAFEAALLGASEEIRGALQRAHEFQDVRRQLRDTARARVKTQQALQSAIKEAQRQAARADAAEAKLAELQGEQS